MLVPLRNGRDFFYVSKNLHKKIYKDIDNRAEKSYLYIVKQNNRHKAKDITPMYNNELSTETIKLIRKSIRV